MLHKFPRLQFSIEVPPNYVFEQAVLAYLLYGSHKANVFDILLFSFQGAYVNSNLKIESVKITLSYIGDLPPVFVTIF